MYVTEFRTDDHLNSLYTFGDLMVVYDLDDIIMTVTQRLMGWLDTNSITVVISYQV